MTRYAVRSMGLGVARCSGMVKVYAVPTYRGVAIMSKMTQYCRYRA